MRCRAKINWLHCSVTKHDAQSGLCIDPLVNDEVRSKAVGAHDSIAFNVGN